MKRRKYQGMAAWGSNGNLLPGRRRGIKTLKDKRGLLPANLDWRSGRLFGFQRNYEIIPGTDKTWYKPFKSKTTNRKDKRGQAKPR